MLYQKGNVPVVQIGAAAAGWSLAAYLQELLLRMPRDEHGIPPWLSDVVYGQAELFHAPVGEEAAQAA